VVTLRRTARHIRVRDLSFPWRLDMPATASVIAVSVARSYGTLHDGSSTESYLVRFV
jgi:hypothetical protein